MILQNRLSIGALVLRRRQSLLLFELGSGPIFGQLAVRAGLDGLQGDFVQHRLDVGLVELGASLH